MKRYSTLRYGQSDVVLNHVLRGARVVAGVLHLGVGDSELDHGGVGRGHPQGVRVPVRDGGGDRDAGLVVDHRVVVVPEHVLRTHHSVTQLARDRHAVAQVHVLLT